MIVPDNPSLLGIDIEGDDWRPLQKDTVERIVTAFESGKRFVFANMPTGSGKTLVATAVQKLLDVWSLNLTHTIALQNQYQETQPWAVIVTGRRNHPCDLPNDIPGLCADDGGPLMADQAPCASGEDCDYISPDGCSYYRMVYSAAEARSVITNYAYATRILQAKGMRGMKRNPFHRGLLVCDEAHLAEDAVVEAAGLRFTRKTWTTAPFDTDDVEVWVMWARRTSIKLGEDIKKIAGNLKELTKEEVRRRKSLVWMKRQTDTLAGLSDEQYDDWIVAREDRSALIRPLWGWSVARELLWGYFPRVLLMSATLGDPNVLARKLGIPIDDVEYIDVPSVFPVQNRPIFYWPLISASRKTSDDEWEMMARAIYYISTQPALSNRKGIVHTASFAVASKLYENMGGHSRFITHGRADPEGKTFDAALMIFEYANEPLVLISPSMSHGIDLPYIIGWQVVAKVPFGDLGDTIVKARRDYKEEKDAFGRRSYDADALNTVIQASGRAVRSADDKGVTYIMDSNFFHLYKRSYSPKSFREAFRWLKK